MKGYITVLQWYSHFKTLGELLDTDKHTGTTAAVNDLLGFDRPEIMPDDPGQPSIGHVVFRVEDDDSLTLVHTHYDSHD